MKRVVVIGGGIGGLSVAFELAERSGQVPGGLEIVLLEAGARLGGNIVTDCEDDFVIEHGPNGFLDNVPATLDLVHRLGLDGRLRRASENASDRFIYSKGKMRKVPTGPLGLVTSGLLSVPGRLRVMFELWARSKPEGLDETVHAFASRRIGKEAASVLVDAMVSGVFAGDSRNLSLASAFPKMAAMEAEYGGLVKAMIAKQRELRRAGGAGASKTSAGPAGPGGTLTSFDGGMAVLVEALRQKLGSAVRLNSTPQSVSRTDGNDRWSVRLETGETIDADLVISTVPANRSAQLFEKLDTNLAQSLRAFSSAPLAVVALGFSAEDIGGAPQGFGVLVPRGEGPRILGCLWDSAVFPNRAGNGRVLIRAMIGGACDSAAVDLSDEELTLVVRNDLKRVMGLSGSPIMSRVYRHRTGIGQYTVGHADRLRVMENRLEPFSGLKISGSSFYGVAMNAVIDRAGSDAKTIIDELVPSKI